MPFNVLTFIFLLTVDLERASPTDPLLSLALESRLGELREMVAVVGGTVGGPADGAGHQPGHDFATRPGDPAGPEQLGPQKAPLDTESGLDIGWRLVIAALPVDAHRFQVNYGDAMVTSRRAEPEAEAEAEAGPGRWKTPEVLARMVIAYLAGAPVGRDDQQDTAGCLGVLALTLLALQDADERKELDIATALSRLDAERHDRTAAERRRLAADLVSLEPVGRAVERLYRPQQPEGLLLPGQKETEGPIPSQQQPSARTTIAPPDASRQETGSTEDERYINNMSHWDSLVFSGLAFLEFGTTSMVLTVPMPSQRESVVLKLVLLTYTRLPAVSQATAAYYDRYHELAVPREEGGGSPTVKVHASSESWILMGRAPGETLHDVLLREAARSAPAEFGSEGLGDRLRQLWPVARVDLVKRYVPPLLDTLERIYARAAETSAGRAESGAPSTGEEVREQAMQQKFCHADLNPKNIMVAVVPETGSVVTTLIDLGRNFVTGRSVAGSGTGQDLYTAPELPLAHNPDMWCDLYSLGQIIVGACCTGRGPDRSVPDALYTIAPDLARLAEDLIDGDPQRRFVLSLGGTPAPEGGTEGGVENVAPSEEPATGPAGDAHPPPAQDTAPDRAFPPEVRPALVEALAAVDRAERRTGRLVTPSTTGILWRLLSPLSGAPGRLRRSAEREDAGATPGATPSVVRYDGWVAFWSRTSAVMWGACVAVTLLFLLRDCGVPVPLPGAVERAQNSATFMDRVSARLTGFSFACCSVKYYQSIYAGLTTRGHTMRLLTDSRQRARALRSAAVTEFWVRGNAVIVAALVIPVNLLRPHWWTVATALGITSAWAVNRVGYRYAALVVAETARWAPGTRLLSRRAEDVPGLSLYKAWGPSMGSYFGIVWVFAALLEAGVLHDVLAYGCVVSAVNIALFYAYKCSIEAEPVRIALTRCYLAAERLAVPSPPVHPVVARSGDSVKEVVRGAAAGGPA
ncbi:hypothetical protein ACIQU5_11685 [Streptomyces sp. NPDC090306]|uniref:hypothetical protein n=1 Tax=Streptomyces sp. NPDC090306 TaxID=3365961 RepID=UPI003812B79C